MTRMRPSGPHYVTSATLEPGAARPGPPGHGGRWRLGIPASMEFQRASRSRRLNLMPAAGGRLGCRSRVWTRTVGVAVAGSPIRVVPIDPEGAARSVRLGEARAAAAHRDALSVRPGRFAAPVRPRPSPSPSGGFGPGAGDSGGELGDSTTLYFSAP
jgi:hypothetical protein